MEKKENKKTMKKVLTVSALALLLGLVGYTGGTTFAKYVSTADPEAETATVAQWGYTLSADATNLFGSKYTGTNLAVVDEEATTGLVVAGSTDGKQVVAPGTTGSMTVSILGQAEVKSALTVNATITDVSLTVPEADPYYPLVWSVKNNDVVVAGVTTAAGVVDYLNSLGNTFEPNNDVLNYNLEISWSWAFSGQNDTYDTYLGQAAAGKELPTGYSAQTDLSVDLAITVEQVQ